MRSWLILLVVGLLLPACATHAAPDTSQLSPEGLRVYNNYKYVRAINEVTTAVTTAGRAGTIPAAAETYYLNAAKAVLDAFQADPRTGHDKAIVLIKTALAALPPNLSSHISIFLLELSDILKGAV